MAEGIEYLPSMPKIGRSKLYTILTDRAYIGEVRFRGQWLSGTHMPIIDRRLWDRVQTLLGQKVYKSHQMTYASDLIECAHCGSPITGERNFEMTKSGEQLLNLRLFEEFDADTYAQKARELREEEAELRLEMQPWPERNHRHCGESV